MPIPPHSQLLREHCALRHVRAEIRNGVAIPHKMADDDLPPLGVMELLPVVLMLLGLSLPGFEFAWAPGAYTDGKMCADVPAIAFAPHCWRLS